MRLRLFDRIRWLAHPRRPPADSAGASGVQGRHRRGRRRGPATAPASPGIPGGPGSPGGPDPARGHAPASGEWSPAGGPPGELAHTASPWPDGSPVSEAPGTPAAPGARGPAGSRAGHRLGGTRDAEASAVRGGAARARIREAPQDAAAVGLGEAARPVPAAPGSGTRWYETAELGLAQSSEASLPDTRAADLARVAAGVPRQPDGTGRSSWRPGGSASHAGNGRTTNGTTSSAPASASAPTRATWLSGFLPMPVFIEPPQGGQYERTFAHAFLLF